MDIILNLIREKTEGVMTAVKSELSGIRANRPTPHLVEDIKVSYAESMLPIKQLGSISIVPPREIQINVWDTGAVQAIAKAIENANIGMNPSIQGATVHMHMPSLNEERRNELMKITKTITERFRIQVRSIRDEINKKVQQLETAKEINEDEKFKLKKKIQEIVDATNASIDAMLEHKLKEIKE